MNQAARQSLETDPSPGSASAQVDPSEPTIAVLLAACAGATDALAFFGLGKAFAGIVTGNLVTVAYGIATGNSSLVKPTVTAVVGSVVGEIAWARLLRRPGAANWPLITELALFLLVQAGWLAAGSHPAGISALALLAMVSVGLGGQSIWALRIHQTTTYFTGMLSWMRWSRRNRRRSPSGTPRRTPTSLPNTLTASHRSLRSAVFPTRCTCSPAARTGLGQARDAGEAAIRTTLANAWIREQASPPE